MPLQATSGAASYDAFGGGVPAVPVYIEQIFSTWLYTGNGSTQTITNGIDLSGKGGLTWIKVRSTSADNQLVDTVRGATYKLVSNTTGAQSQYTTGLTSFNADGFSIGTNTQYNNSGATYASWSFAKAPKFFDVVTWTGNNTGYPRAIAHNLGSTPGVIITKRTDSSNDWYTYHRSLGATKYLTLNSTSSEATYSGTWGDTSPTDTNFYVQGNETNATGGTYVAYLFAHDAGGFGLTGTDNVISCGSFTTDSSGNATVNLGYEPQFWLYKPNLAARYWQIYDTMRGWSQTQIANLAPNRSDAEGGGAATAFYPTATGFDCVGGNLDASTQHIYIAIRRGPMKVPTVGTSVFSPVTRAGNSVNPTVVTTPNFAVDMQISTDREKVNSAWNWSVDKLRGTSVYLPTNRTDSEYSDTDSVLAFTNTGFNLGLSGRYNASGSNYIYWNFRRAPSFFDEVCYDGAASPQNVTHNLGAVPEMMIFKSRNTASTSWVTYHKGLNGGTTPQNYFVVVQSDQAESANANVFDNTAPTSSVFTVGAQGSTSLAGRTYVAYLFATCAGVSKVGSYTGTATTKQIDCGFTGGARFVLIKRTDSTGDWYVWDTARGIVSGNDPHLSLNTTAAEVTSTDYIDTYSAGFEISSTAPAAINASGGTFIFLAIA